MFIKSLQDPSPWFIPVVQRERCSGWRSIFSHTEKKWTLFDLHHNRWPESPDLVFKGFPSQELVRIICEGYQKKCSSYFVCRHKKKRMRQQATLVHTQRTRLKSTTCMSEAEEEYWRMTIDKEKVSGEKETEREWKAYGEWLMCGGEQPHEWTNVPINNLGKLNRQEEITRDLAEQAWNGQWESLFLQCNTHLLFLFICCLLFTTMQPRFKDIICYILVSTPDFGTEYMQRGHCSWISICIAHF